MKCKICGSDSVKLFEKKILNKYSTNYYQCRTCEFIQTDEPTWLKESYSSAITSLDLGLLTRNFILRQEVARIIDCGFSDSKIMLDYAGGYGVFVRIMRDSGFNFYREDPYCENIFAKEFDITNITTKKFDLVTAFEVFEHFENPIEDIEKIFSYSDSVIFSTDLIPSNSKSEIENWWYISPEIGQHIAFYSKHTFEYLAKKYNKNYYYKDKNIHILTSKTFDKEQIEYLFDSPKSVFSKIVSKLFKRKKFSINRKTLLWDDYELIKNKTIF